MKSYMLLLSLTVLSATLPCRSSAGSASSVTIKIQNFTYNPNPITVPVGATVTWVNTDIVPHDVVSDDKTFKSKLLEKDEHFSYVFSKPGTYHYVCSIHPKMTANVIVQ